MGTYLTGTSNTQNQNRSAEFYTQKTKEGLDTNSSPKEMVEIFIGLRNVDNYSAYSVQVQIIDDDEVLLTSNSMDTVSNLTNRTFLNLGATMELKILSSLLLIRKESSLFEYFSEKKCLNNSYEYSVKFGNH